MRILLTTLGSRGDVEPLAGLAVALKARGAEVRICASADVEFIDLIDRAGVEFAPAFMPIRAMIAQAKREPRPLPELAVGVMAAQIEAVGAAAEDCDLILATGLLPSAAASRCVAELRGLPYVHASLCPQYLPSEHHAPNAYPGRAPPEGVTDNRLLWAHDVETLNAIFGPAVNGNRVRVGLAPVESVRGHVFTDQPWLSAEPELAPWTPTDLCDPVVTGALVLKDDRPLPNDLEAFLGAGEAPVHIGFGSLPTHDPREAARIAVEAVRGHGRRVVLQRGWAGLERIDDGQDVFVVGEANQQALFARVAAVVHHGGAGTTTTATRAGAAQVVVPQIADQPFWGARVVERGLGAAHDGPIPTVESLSAALGVALAPETQGRAKAVAAGAGPDGSSEAADRLIARIRR